MIYQTLLLSHEDGVAALTLNRPQSYNAISVTMLQELLLVLDEIEADDSLRAVLITGAGRAFSSGGDLTGPLDPEIDDPSVIPGLPPEHRDAVLARIGDKIGANLRAHHNPVAMRLHTFPKPVVCAVNGVAAGGAIGMALCCDIVVAARSARFVPVFTPTLAFVPDFACSWHLTRLLGAARASALALLGEPLSAEDAERHGLLWKVFDDAELVAGAMDIARRVGRNSRNANRLTKQAMQAAQRNDLSQQLALEADFQQHCGSTLDFIEGVLAFQQKRKPQFNRSPEPHT
ncbi:MAG: 2-(1,2-epoxy,2-dihydrophenyl)acetyl-CoA isomerase [Hydrocarboniphaga sp.]|uniref:enoyl-CoA hydratase-related protein n=1 Tax=Hydrocarboniphaga sp. TaxID=2033016 RepID=UPI00260B88A6|nr:enoyl-CoA hydratase-related protein [Hydrocarboniphaga sp.]MDB5970142.1 2-(1,2-epoxy,2-dihydrophenyl)acetyl-CoA isomerase [Hydrocarboniphaga sp.]